VGLNPETPNDWADGDQVRNLMSDFVSDFRAKANP
jgi:hypothetical protein